MDDRIRREICEFVVGLAAREQKTLAAADTFVEIEELTAEIGDEVVCQLANLELSRRSKAVCEERSHACPDCGHQADRPFAEWIWQGRVESVIDELRTHQERIGLPDQNASESDLRQRLHRVLTYYTNHRHRMNSPEYRRRGLPLTSSHIESAIKQINARVKDTEKFWRQDHANAILQLRANSLSHSKPMDIFWIRWQANQNGANRYRTTRL